MKRPEQAIIAERIVITRRKVSYKLGVRLYTTYCSKFRKKEAIPRIIGMEQRSFAARLLFDASSIPPAIKNARIERYTSPSIFHLLMCSQTRRRMLFWKFICGYLYPDG